MKRLLSTAAIVAIFVASSLANIGHSATTRSCATSVRVAGREYVGTVTRSIRTSCPFARNVERAALRQIVRAGGAGDGDLWTVAYSPVTLRWYAVHCTADGDLYRGVGIHVDCRAGVGARVVFWAWAL
jgi:hypothetical protein